MARSREARKSRRIQRLRVLLLLALVATVALVSIVLVRRLRQEPPPAPESVGPETIEATGDMVTVGEGFERTVTEGDRSLFTVRGASYAVDRNGRVFLDGVEVIVFGDDDEVYEIRSPEARFRPEEQEARLTGGVTLSGPDDLSMETSALELLQRGRLITSRGQVYIRMGDRLHARANQLKVALRGRQFHLVGHARVQTLEAATVPFEMTAQLLTIDRSRHLIEAEDGPVRLYHRADWLVSNHIVAFLDDEEERVQYLRADERVLAELRPEAAKPTVPAESAAPPETPRATEGAETAESPETARSPETAESLETAQSLQTAQSLEDTDSPEAPQGPGATDSPGTQEEATEETTEAEAAEPAPRWREGDDPFARRPAARLGRSADRALVRIHAESLEMEMTPDGLHPSWVQVVDGPGSRAVLRWFPAGAGPVHRIRAPAIEARFDAGVPARVDAGEEVELTVIEAPPARIEQAVDRELAAWVAADEEGPGEEGAGDTAEPVAPETDRRATGRRAKAVFDAAGALSTVSLFEQVVLTDQGPGGETRARGAQAVFRADDGTVEVTGSPARVRTPRVEMDAPTLTYTRADGILHGTGGVRARLEDAARTALGGTPLADGEGPVWVEAEEGFFREDPRSFLFRGAVRTWRGEDLLTAKQLRGDDVEQRLLANGDVRTLWRPEEEGPDDEAGGEPAAGGGPVEVTADRMRFEQDRRLLIYTGSVVAEQQDRVVSCRKMHLVLSPEGAEGSTIRRFVCTGDVLVTEPPTASGGSRTLRGHRAVYVPGERTVEVFGAPDGIVTMKDPDGNVIEGPRMIYEIDRERVQVLPRVELPPAPDDDEADGSEEEPETPEEQESASGEPPADAGVDEEET